MRRCPEFACLARNVSGAVAAVVLGLVPSPGGDGARADTAAAGPFPAEHAARAFPDADRIDRLEGNPPAAPAYRGEELGGYLFSTRQVTGSTGYAGKPLDLLVGLDTQGRITGASILAHHEPILVIGISDADLDAFVAQYSGLDVRRPVRLAGARVAGMGLRGQAAPEGVEAQAAEVDGISGASISAVVINDAILRSARIVARSSGIIEPEEGAGVAALDFDWFEEASWPELIDDGSLARLTLSVADVDAAFVKEGAPAWSERGRRGFAPEPSATFIDLYLALARPAAIGRNLLGDGGYNRLMAGLSPGDQPVLVAGRGLYSFKGTGFVRTGVFDRIQLVQGARTIPLETAHHTLLERLAARDAPVLREIGLFVVPAEAGLDPAQPWRLEILVAGGGPQEGAERQPSFAAFTLPYRLPDTFFRARPAGPAEAEEAQRWPLWQEVWWAHPVKIAVLVLALVVLTVTLVLQDWIERRPRFYNAFRLGFLTFTLVWIGWYAGAQLSVINVITFIQALLTGFRWEFFLLGPLMFILWSFVAVAMLFWGRGVFCGWLCPFGALQELLNTTAKALRVPQITVPFAIQERLWMVKYVLFIALLGISFYSVPYAVTGAEIEPFKTAMSLGFAREWPFVAFAAGLLAAGLFVERFYCRYLCALGAALALPARLRMFEWLKRRPQCGRECHICAVECTVGAIHPDGHINLNECIYCLNCQILYYDDQVCPPVIARRKRREARAAGHGEASPVAAGPTER
jgi:transcriptional regulator of nitric oxide reductase